MFNIFHLKPADNLDGDLFKKPVPEQPEAIYVEKNTAIKQSYELERLLNRRKRRIRKKKVVEYLVR